MGVEIRLDNDYLHLRSLKEDQSHGPEKSRETQENKDQFEAAGILQQDRRMQKNKLEDGFPI